MIKLHDTPLVIFAKCTFIASNLWVTPSESITQGSRSGGAGCGNLPAEEEEVVPAEFATERLTKPKQGLLESISRTYLPKLDGAAKWTARRE